MSKRPIEQKQRRRIAKQFRRTTPPLWFDLAQWLQDHKHASTRKEAKTIILAEKVKSDSHVVGVEQISGPHIKGKAMKIVNTTVPLELKDRLMVIT